MVSLDNTLERIALSFTVKDIMVPMDKLTKAPDEKIAQELLDKSLEYDVIPIYKGDEIFKYLERGHNKANFIKVADTMSDATSILEVVDILLQRHFGFILSGNRVVGYLHFSDLNNALVKIPFYVMFEALEYALVQRIAELVDEDCLRSAMDPDRYTACVGKMERLRRKDADQAWTSLLHFSEIISVARNFKFIDLDDTEKDILASIRNRVDHATDPLIDDYSSIKKLAVAKRISLNLLDKLQ